MYLIIHLTIGYLLFISVFTSFEWIVMLLLVIIYVNIVLFERNLLDKLGEK